MWIKNVLAVTPNQYRVINAATSEVVFSTPDIAEFEAFCSAHAAQFEEEPEP